MAKCQRTSPTTHFDQTMPGLHACACFSKCPLLTPRGIISVRSCLRKQNRWHHVCQGPTIQINEFDLISAHLGCSLQLNLASDRPSCSAETRVPSCLPPPSLMLSDPGLSRNTCISGDLIEMRGPRKSRNAWSERMAASFERLLASRGKPRLGDVPVGARAVQTGNTNGALEGWRRPCHLRHGSRTQSHEKAKKTTVFLSYSFM